MQVNAINRLDDTKFTSIRPNERRALEGLAYADDSQLRSFANRKASIDVNDKKHKKVSNALFWSIPLAAGVAAFSAVKGKLPVKVDRARSAALSVGLNTALGWIGTFLAIDVVFAAKESLAKHSGSVRKFDKDHPFLSFATTIAASLAAIAGGKAGFAKLAAKNAAKPLSRESLRFLAKANKKINNSKVLNKISESIQKIPSSIRAAANSVIQWSPSLLLIGSVVHSIDHSKAKMLQANNNYASLKLAQAEAKNVLDREDLLQSRVEIKNDADIDFDVE
jgi:hypothetical protein